MDDDKNTFVFEMQHNTHIPIALFLSVACLTASSVQFD